MPALLASFNSTNVRNALLLAVTRLQVSVASAFAPGATVKKAQRLFLTPPRFAHPQRERDLLATARGYVVDSSLARLSAWRFGRSDRPAVLLSHGWGGRGSQFRHFIPALLDAGYQVVTFDHAAHGYSEGRESSLVHFTHGVEAVARDLESRGVKIAGAIGHSLGAAALGSWLNRSGANVRTVLVAPPHSIEKYSTRFARHLGLPEKLRQEMQQGVERRLGTPWSEFELPQAVERVQAPALVIHDADDRDVPIASGLAVARSWKGARFVRTQGLGHRAILRDADVVRDALDFLAGEVVFAHPPARDEGSAFAVPSPIL